VKDLDLICYQFSTYSPQRFHVFCGVATGFTEVISPFFVPLILCMHIYYPRKHFELGSVNCEPGTKPKPA
jgi:hypothetical protein